MEIESLLKESLNRNLKKMGENTPPNLEEAIQYSLLAPGKRIRPRLLLACGQMLGLTVQQGAPAAMAIEMIHCFTLIHDDLPCMDDDDFRRGMPSNHKKFGEGLALLAGDALMALAVDVFMDSPVEPKPLLEGLRRLIAAVGPRGVIGGQAAESLLGTQSTLEDLYSMHAKKTGALFVASLLIPKDFAQVSDESAEGRVLSSFAHQLGLAFQIADDLEDAAETKNGVDPTSVLTYVAPDKVSQITIQKLQISSLALEKIWGAQAHPLMNIADEVVEKMEKATRSLSTILHS